MKIQIISDLHVDFSQNYQWVLNNLKSCADVLVIAGDICPDGYVSTRNTYRKLIRHLSSLWSNIIIVPGNHDFWGYDSDNKNFTHCHDIISEYSGTVHYVNNDFVTIGEITFLCSTLWSLIIDNAIGVRHGMNDYYEIKNHTILKNNDYHLQSKLWLEETIVDFNKVVIVTHHLPSYSLIDSKFYGDPLSEAFVVNMNDFIDKWTEKIPYWIHGHSHSLLQRTLGETCFIRNPLGYYFEELKCDPSLVIDV